MKLNLKNTAKKILIIDDEKHIAEAIKINLKLLGHEVIWGINGLEGLNYFEKFSPDLVIVDLMMPEIDGIGVITQIRKLNPKIPILVISAKEQVREKIKCLSLGADDYLSKPFDLDEFLLRVDRLLTRAEWNENRTEATALNNNEFASEVGEQFSFGPHRIDFKQLKAYAFCKEERVQEVYELTLQEAKILKVFFSHPNIPLSRSEILKKAQGQSPGVTSRSLDNFIVRFRKYFEEDPKRPLFFKSIRSVGYLFSPSSS